jgi:hypothetical protein
MHWPLALAGRTRTRFYRVLLQALPPGVIVCPKVRLMDVVAVPDGLWASCGAPGSGMHLLCVLGPARYDPADPASRITSATR